MRERTITCRDNPALLNTRTIVLNEGSPETKREDIRAYFHATFDIDEALLETLRYDEAFTRRADPLRHPLIFYFGHTAAFYINKFIVGKLLSKRINAQFESMFAIGVDEMSWDDLNDAHYDWPTVEAVQQYRNQVRDCVDGLISTLPLTLPITWDNPFWIIMMGIEHARIHLETSSVLIRQLPLELLWPHPLWSTCKDSGEPPTNDLVNVSGRSFTWGKDKTHPLYGWDNEFGTHRADVHDFRASRMLVSNREFLGFMEDGGYENDDWWTDEGRAWRDYGNVRHPRFWILDGTSYKQRNMLEVVDMPWNWPVEINQLEAKAFCNWKAAQTGKPIRLPTEDEWLCLRDQHIDTDQPYWSQAPGNINLEGQASSCPVDRHAFGDFYDIVGNVWQWTETPISGFRGFDVHPCYDDFSTPTFDGKHNLIKGGSWISTGNEATRDCRYAFRRHFYQHAGLRYVESEQRVQVAVDVYETDEQLCQYCEFHYGEPALGVPNYSVTCATRCIALMQGRPMKRALDIGCSVGRTTFELARAFEQVTGLDFSANFIRMAIALQEQGAIRYTRLEEGELTTFIERTADELEIKGLADKVEFYQADACNLKALYSGYDLVFAGNLIDRLYNPRKFLATIHERINPGGLLVITSPYTWLEAFTERDEWLGGYRRDGEPYTTLEALHECLSAYFKPIVEPEDIPFVIRETRRKHQHTIAELTAWERL
jgi:5-histidylcysteine sulfoxide synthase/putative 4-mercaptohistidine N1-methyltranferase